MHCLRGRDRMLLRFGHGQVDFHYLLAPMQFFDEQVCRFADRKVQVFRRPDFSASTFKQQITGPDAGRVSGPSQMDILKHPAFCSVHPDSLKSGVYCMACGNVSHSRVAKSRMAGLQLSDELVNLLLESRRIGAFKDLFSPALSKRVPVHAVHAWIEMLLQHQVADLIEDFCALVESQIHVWIPIGVEVSPTLMNAAQSYGFRSLPNFESMSTFAFRSAALTLSPSASRL